MNVEEESIAEDTEWKRDPLGCSGVVAPLWHGGDTTGGLGVTGLGNRGTNAPGICMRFGFCIGVDGHLRTLEVLFKVGACEDTSGAECLIRLTVETFSSAGEKFWGSETI